MPTQTSVSTSLTDVPAILRPYITDKGGILPTAQALTSKNYADTYGNALRDANLAGSQRVASLSPMQTQIGNELSGMKTPTQFGAGTNAVQSGIDTLQGMTDAGQTQAFMSPYIQNVLDVNKQEATRDAQRNLLSQNLAAGRTGSYGASGNILAQAEAQRNYQTQLGKIQAAGMQSAFEDARKAQIAKAAGLNQAGSTMGQLGTAQQASDIDRIKTQGAFGDLQRSVQQSQLDTQYNDLMAKLNFPLTQLETMNNLARGVPLTQTGQTMTQTTPPPSFASQFAGMGLTGLSLYNLLGNRP
jgi:hypothetical protein